MAAFERRESHDQLTSSLRPCLIPSASPCPPVSTGAEIVSQLSFQASVTRLPGRYCLEVPSADHGLELADDAAGSVEVLRQVVSRLDRFIGSLGR